MPVAPENHFAAHAQRYDTKYYLCALARVVSEHEAKPAADLEHDRTGKCDGRECRRHEKR